nr:hypothetical protein [Tanacetum cinerariifolium]GEW45466.1 hypothetical protein [Tanacetum cinerariifolium]
MSSSFAVTHNMVAILAKSDVSEGFDQIIDFLNGSYILYALTVNPHIYVSYIKQFWNNATVKHSGDVTRLQALVDRKKVMISEAVIREVLQLDDAEGVDCLPNEEIFVGLAQMRYEKPMRRIGKGFLGVETPLFEGMLAVREIVEEGITEAQVYDTTAATVQEDVHDEVIPSRTPPPSHDIPSTSQVQSLPPPQPQTLPQAYPQGAEFPMHLLQQALDTCAALTHRIDHLEHDKASQKLEIIKLQARVKKLERANKVKTSKLRRLKKVRTSHRIESSDEIEDVFNQGRMIDELDKDEGIKLVDEQVKDTAEVKGRQYDKQAEKQAEIYQLDLDHPSKILSMQEDDSEVQEAVEVVTIAKLITEVVTAATSQVSAASATISAAKPSIPATALTVVAAYTRKRKRVIIKDPKEELSTKTPAETPTDAKSKDKGKVMKKRPQTESKARKKMMVYLKNTAGYKLDYFKGMSYDDIRPIFQVKFDANMRFLLKKKEQMEEEDREALKSINETPAQKAAKRRKLNEEAKEVEDLKKHLERVPDEDDDVFTEANPLARKVPVINYQIVKINNKPRYKIIKADETHLLYTSFITLLKNFDREDLENLWSIVKERFSTSKPNYFSDEYLLSTLKAMFERTDGQDAVWKSQRSVHGQALVKSWKLLTLCGVHIISLSTTQLILFVERRYPLSKFTLEQLVNVVRLQVEKESEISLELLSLKLKMLKDNDAADTKHFINVVSYELLPFGLLTVAVVKLMLLGHKATATVKKVNDVVQLRALIDGKKVVVSEAIIRRDLHLDDVDGVECLPNKEILEELVRMRYEKPPPKLTFYKAFFFAQWKFLIHTLVQCLSAKRTAWNEFSCFMASAVICLATGRKFNLSKYIFDRMVRNVDSPSKFLMYPRFLQVVTDNQVDDMTSHNTRYTSPTLTEKVFTNIRRIRKGFSSLETPLFASMMVQPQPQANEEVEVPIAPSPHALQDPTSTPHATPLQDQPLTPYASLTHEQPTTTSESSMSLLTTLMKTYVTIRMAQNLIKLKAKKAKLPDEQIAQRLHDKEVQKATTRDKQEKADMERALELKKQYDDKEENIDWSVVVEQNMVGYKMEHFRGVTYDKVRPIFEKEYKKVQTLFKLDKDVEEPKKKRVADETLFKKLKAAEVSGFESTQEIPSNDLKEMTKEDVQNVLEIFPVLESKVKALQVKYPIIDWEIYAEVVPSKDKEKALWIELKRLFEPDTNDVLWKLQRYMHAQLTLKLYTDCGVHHVSSTRRHDIFMLIENDYPLSNAVMILMLSGKLQVKEDNEMARDLVMKISWRPTNQGVEVWIHPLSDQDS